MSIAMEQNVNIALDELRRIEIASSESVVHNSVKTELRKNSQQKSSVSSELDSETISDELPCFV